MKKQLLCAALCAAVAGLCFGQANFTRGEELFMQNKPAEALAFLENSIAEDPSRVQAFLYLGIAYEQLNRLDEAVSVYRKILSRAGDLTACISANLGNVYFRRGNFDYAGEFYSQALAADSGYSSAYLGRANSRIKAGELTEAVADYELYLALEPRSPQRAQIERMVAFIRSEFAAEERRRLLAEQAAREEAERRQKLMDELAASLQSAAGDSQGLSSGAENLETYSGEFELE